MKEFENMEFNTDCAKPIKNLPENHYCRSYQLCFKERTNLESYLCCNFCKNNSCFMKCSMDCKTCDYFFEKEWILDRCFKNHMFDKNKVKSEIKQEKKDLSINNTEQCKIKEIAAKEPVKIEEKEIEEVENKITEDLSNMSPCELW